MSEPILSIVMPVYNAAASVGEVLQSVLTSDYTDIEVLCVNDGSTDESGGILEAIAESDTRVRVMHQANSGASAARNKAIQSALGKYVTFVDADDYISPTYLGKMVTAAEGSYADCVVTGWTRCSANGEKHEHLIAEKETLLEQPEAHELAALPAQMCARLYTRSILQHSGATFPAGIQYGEDTVFHYCVYPWCKRVLILPEAGYYYREAEGSLSTARSKRVPEMLNGAEFLVKIYQEKEVDGYGLLLHFINHALKRIRSMAPHNAQAPAAAYARSILEPLHLENLIKKELRRKDAAILLRILEGSDGLNASYYWKRFTRFIRGK